MNSAPPAHATLASRDAQDGSSESSPGVNAGCNSCTQVPGVTQLNSTQLKCIDYALEHVRMPSMSSYSTLHYARSPSSTSWIGKPGSRSTCLKYLTECSPCHAALSPGVATEQCHSTLSNNCRRRTVVLSTLSCRTEPRTATPKSSGGSRCTSRCPKAVYSFCLQNHAQEIKSSAA